MSEQVGIELWKRLLDVPQFRINQYGTVAILVMLLLVMNPELRVFLLLTNFIGLDLMIFFIAIQLRYLLPAVPPFQQPMPTFLCVAGYTTLRFAARMIALLLAPADRATAGLTTLLFILSKNMWCPTLKPDSTNLTITRRR